MSKRVNEWMGNMVKPHKDLEIKKLLISLVEEVDKRKSKINEPILTYTNLLIFSSTHKLIDP